MKQRSWMFSCYSLETKTLRIDQHVQANHVYPWFQLLLCVNLNSFSGWICDRYMLHLFCYKVLRGKLSNRTRFSFPCKTKSLMCVCGDNFSLQLLNLIFYLNVVSFTAGIAVGFRCRCITGRHVPSSSESDLLHGTKISLRWLHVGTGCIQSCSNVLYSPTARRDPSFSACLVHFAQATA